VLLCSMQSAASSQSFQGLVVGSGLPSQLIKCALQ
jgi:hypothetical protein